MHLSLPRWSLACLLALISLTLRADPEPKPDAAAEEAAAKEAQRLVESLKPQSGVITLHDGLAKISLPENYAYLSPADTQTVLVKLWGNPGGSSTLGMIVPKGFNPLADESWAAIITYSDDGYVNDSDAAKINYTDLLKEMQEGIAEANKDRVKSGYEAIQLVGWATPPRYDAATHKLYWAKELKFGDNTHHTLNYNIRMLGRRGVLVVNAVARMDQLKEVEGATPSLLAMVDFQEGHRYTDFNGETDKVATYGIAALVAGGVAAKAGLFKTLWIGLLAFKKFIIIGLVALAGSFKKAWEWFRNRKAVTAAPSSPPPAA